MDALCSLVLLGLASSCPTVYALGDSNTCFGWPCFRDGWPEQLTAMLRAAGSEWQVENRGIPGMFALAYPGNKEKEIGEGEPVDVGWHLEKLLVEENLHDVCDQSLVPVGPPPKLVLAVGTNDLMHTRNFAIADRILTLKQRVEKVAPCVEVYVALVPPRYGDTPLAAKFDIEYINVMLRAHVAPERLLDFHTGFPPDLYFVDGGHLNHAGKRRRAEIAYAVLFPEIASRFPPRPEPPD